MKKCKILICVLVLIMSCKDEPKKTTTPEKETTEVRDSNDFLVFDNPLVKNDIDDAEYSNIGFKNEGAVFTRNLEKPSYIKIPFSDLDFSKEFNISFTFKTTFDDGRKPQTLLAFINNTSSTFRIPLYVYLPRNKISGVYGEQHLYYEDYNKANRESKVFLASKKVGIDKLYFVSINYTKNNVLQVYLNSELYATYDNLVPHDLKSTHLVIGSMIQKEKAILPFDGTMYGMKIYSVALTESEITDVFNSLPSFLEL